MLSALCGHFAYLSFIKSFFEPAHRLPTKGTIVIIFPMLSSEVEALSRSVEVGKDDCDGEVCC